MQFAEVLSRDEVKALARFAHQEEVEYILSQEETPVISLRRTVEAGGRALVQLPGQPQVVKQMFRSPQERFERGGFVFAVPKLAVALPALAEVHYTYRHRTMYYTDMPRRSQRQRWELQLDGEGYRETPENLDVSAKLPPLPKEAREAIKDYPGSLVLWEADWAVREVPPSLGDPAIIVPIIKDLYAVAYTWDLTPLEREALAKALG